MRPPTQIMVEDLIATMLEVIRSIPPDQIASEVSLGRRAREILKIDSELAALAQPVFISATAKDGAATLMRNLELQADLRRSQNFLLIKLMEEAAPLFGKALIQRLIKKPPDSC